MPMPPYTTKAGIRIGIAYQRYQRPAMDGDAYRLQRALLADDKALREARAERRLTAAMAVMLAAVVTALAAGWI